MKLLEIKPMKAEALDFAPGILRVQRQPPSPLPRRVLYVLLLLFGALLVWAYFGRLDIIAVAYGKLVPENFLQIVQPAESGIVKEILVREGDHVKAGQVLARMDAFESTADKKMIKAELVARDLELRRVDAELNGKPFKRKSSDPVDLFREVQGQYQSNRKAYEDALGTERATLDKAQQDLKAAIEIEDKLEKSTAIYKQKEEALKILYKKKFASRLKYLEQQRIRIETEQNLRAQKYTIAGLKATIAQSKHRIAQITSDYRQNLQNERVKAEGDYKKLQQQWVKQKHRHQLLELRAPRDGIIKGLSTHTAGTVVEPGTVLMTLVPSDVPLKAEVWVTNLDAGFVREKQTARIKLRAYPFQRYGMVNGEVEQISPDTGSISKNATEQQRNNNQATLASSGYRTLITLDTFYLEQAGYHYPLFPGMQVTAEIHLGSRTILEYLLSPIRKVISEAAHEK